MEDPLLIENTDISSAHQDATHPNKQVSCSSNPIANCSGESIAEIQGPPTSKSSSSNAAGLGLLASQNAEDVDMDDDEEDAEVHDDDSSYVPDDSEGDSDKELGDEHECQENQLK